MQQLGLLVEDLPKVLPSEPPFTHFAGSGQFSIRICCYCLCRLVFVHRPKVISDYIEAQKTRSVPRLALDPECLRWTPVITRASLDEEFELAESDVSGYPL